MQGKDKSLTKTELLRQLTILAILPTNMSTAPRDQETRNKNLEISNPQICAGVASFFASSSSKQGGFLLLSVYSSPFSFSRAPG